MPPVNVSGPFYAMPEEFENEGFTLKTHKMFYYIKVSGIASGNKLIKTIRYPHM